MLTKPEAPYDEELIIRLNGVACVRTDRPGRGVLTPITLTTHSRWNYLLESAPGDWLCDKVSLALVSCPNLASPVTDLISEDANGTGFNQRGSPLTSHTAIQPRKITYLWHLLLRIQKQIFFWKSYRGSGVFTNNVPLEDLQYHRYLIVKFIRYSDHNFRYYGCILPSPICFVIHFQCWHLRRKVMRKWKPSKPFKCRRNVSGSLSSESFRAETTLRWRVLSLKVTFLNAKEVLWNWSRLSNT